MNTTGRLTGEWTETLEEAYGDRGAYGRAGELFVKKVIESWGWEVKDNESNFKEQVAGIDLWIKKPTWAHFYSIDVKANMGPLGTFYVDTNRNGWLFSKKKTSDRIWHVNVDTGWMAWYGRREMQHYLTNDLNIVDAGMHPIHASQKIPFITRSKA